MRRFFNEIRNARHYLKCHVLRIRVARPRTHVALFTPRGPVAAHKTALITATDLLLEGHRIQFSRVGRCHLKKALQHLVADLALAQAGNGSLQRREVQRIVTHP